MNFLPESSLAAFLDILASHGEIHGPGITDDGIMCFRKIKSAEDLHLDYRRTLLPPKKYLLPPRQITFTWDPDSGYALPAADEHPIILFGLHACDLAGIAYLDYVFLSDRQDAHYAAKRSALTLIGISCEPDDYCFCTSAGKPEQEFFDLFLERNADGFHISSGSKAGELLHSKLMPLLEKREPPESRPREFRTAVAVRESAARGEKHLNSPLWDEFAGLCLSCGACSLCCPTCYCFDIREYGAMNSNSTQRVREWDNCLFRSHGEVAGGHNFRERRTDRFHYRYQHKYLGFGPTRGIVSCVGCGRCREVCPVKIDLLRLFCENNCSHDQD